MTPSRRWVLAAAGAAAAFGARADERPIVVGGKNFTEQQLMAEMTAALLRARGLPVAKRAGYTTTSLRRAQEAGEVDLCWEYTGTSLVTFNGVTERLDRAATFERVKRLDAARELLWLAPSRVDNTYALAMRRADCERLKVRTLSDLAALIRGGQALRLGVNSEFFSRADGLRPLASTYGFALGPENVVRIDTSLVYHALRDRQIDVGLVFSTDGRIEAYELGILGDDRRFFPDYTMAPVVRRPALESHPALVEALGSLAGRLDNAVMGRLNGAVDIGKRSVEEVAAGFLRSEGLA